MVMQTVPQPTVANVLPIKGVPKLWSKVITSAEAVASVELATLLQNYLIQQADKQWGIFDKSGQPVFTSGRVRAVDIGKERSITTVPMENGAFASVNKSARPNLIRVEMLCDGSSASLGNANALDSLLAAAGAPGATSEQRMRSSFMSRLDAIVDDTNLYSVATPEQTFSNMNIVGYSLRRSAERGITLLWADIRMEEVRGGAKAIIPHTSASSGITTATPAGAKMLNSGIVNPITVPARTPIANILGKLI